MSNRPAMLASAIRAFVAPALRICPPECGIVAITDVQVSSDLAHATIYISSLHEPERALKFLEAQRATLQRDLSAMHRKRIPLIRFRIDAHQERANRLDELLS